MVLGGQELGCPPKVLAIGAKVGVLEDAFAISQSSEVIPQHTPTAIGQSSRYANDPFQVFVAGEAMGEEQPTTRFCLRDLENPGEGQSMVACELNSLAFPQAVLLIL